MSKPILASDITRALKVVSTKITYRLDQKGTLAFNSRHEILGVIQEEYSELVDAVHTGNNGNVSDELLDIAVACIIGMISVGENYTKW